MSSPDNLTRRDRRADFNLVEGFLIERQPFRFLRFSDGEVDILRNSYLFLSPTGVVARRQQLEVKYPNFDSKEFIPERDFLLREHLMQSMSHTGPFYLKGIVTSSTRSVVEPGAGISPKKAALEERNYLVELNGGQTNNLTFWDLFMSSNYRKFRSRIVPIFADFDDVLVVGNFRTSLSQFPQNWRLEEVPDNFFPEYFSVRERTLDRILNLPKGALVLASASSLSEIIGFEVDRERPDITFFDVGSSMHDLFGLEVGIRHYHWEMVPWSGKTALRKIRYRLRPSYLQTW